MNVLDWINVILGLILCLVVSISLLMMFLGWVADGCGDWIIARVFRRKKRVVMERDDGSREEKFGVRGYL